ncbi:AbfB domain-containing protein [Streptomyces sp. NPDC093586]|uniref:AbfB domain-containing protein n=1 Tax=Streptomyces sp. NPDC093586 TaxID=3366042 RepID=UPI003819A11D
MADSQFRVVTGLAGSGTVSLALSSRPTSPAASRATGTSRRGRENDGTALFRGDASWVARAGPAGATGVSYESYNFPGHFLRPYEYLLRGQVPGTATDRADATFVLR